VVRGGSQTYREMGRIGGLYSRSVKEKKESKGERGGLRSHVQGRREPSSLTPDVKKRSQKKKQKNNKIRGTASKETGGPNGTQCKRKGTILRTGSNRGRAGLPIRETKTLG